ncbi:ribonuclease Y [Melissospora conviva]|uniref:ribonuclease Y n=1 Tax=Melissospora conviva TaxID=3388432 RepID=UPI003B7D3618
MSGLMITLLVAVALLAAVVVVALLLGLRTVRNLGAAGAAPVADPALDAERDRQEQSLAALRNAADEAYTTADIAKSAAAAARAEAAAAQAEAEAARAEARRVLDAARAEADTVLERAHRQAEADAEQLRAAARRSGERESAMLAATTREQAAEVERRAQRMDERERLHTEDVERLAERERGLLAAAAQLTQREEELKEREAALQLAEEERRRALERIAGLTAEAARSQLIESLETQAKREAALLIRDIETDARNTAEQRARGIVVDAIQRVASEQTAESVVSVLHLPGDEMKGRIIGREGRNIRTFESVTGVNLIIDDTPEAVLLSCFDPVRREIGRLTLEKLVLDGRIHPHRIEEVYDRARSEVDELCERAAADALRQVGITDLHPELTSLLGRLRYRTSYGQNVLKHLIETAHIAGMMAAELRLDVPTVKRAAFLHDIGKALTHEVEGSHAIIGADLARRYGESEEVVHAIEAHHNEVPPQTVEAVLTQASDACSGGRPGARRESLEVYVKRLERIEEIAAGKLGVEKVFAMQAGREIRVMVKPDEVDDIGAAVLARDVAKQIEEELTYPGQIRVTVVRESRATEVAR